MRRIKLTTKEESRYTYFQSKRSLSTVLLLVLLFWTTRCETEFPATESANQIPTLLQAGSAKQLYVDGRPFLILGGELHNSSASSLPYLEARWEKLVSLNLNTVLAPITWDLLEPEEGRFDFTLVDGLIKLVRSHRE